MWLVADTTNASVAGMEEVVQLDMFVVSAVDPPWRDNRDAMEYPFLALQKRRTKPIEFRKSGLSLEVHAPVKFGIATIWDWDGSVT